MPSSPAERRKIYLKRKKNGCCPRCGQKVKKNSKFTFCDSCRLFFRGYFSEVSDEINEVRKARYNNRKKNNLCPRCGTPLGLKYTKTICKKCLNKQYEYNYGAKRKAKPKTVTKPKLVSKTKKKTASKPKVKATKK
jgi:Zn finger protein HypA/HybF involved in hydrogenase expression